MFTLYLSTIRQIMFLRHKVVDSTLIYQGFRGNLENPKICVKQLLFCLVLLLLTSFAPHTAAIATFHWSNMELVHQGIQNRSGHVTSHWKLGSGYPRLCSPQTSVVHQFQKALSMPEKQIILTQVPSMQFGCSCPRLQL